MHFEVKKVKPFDDYKLILTFQNGENRLFDMKPYLNKGIFRELRDISLFNTAHVSFDTVEWDNECDFDPEVLYMYSKKISSPRKTRNAALREKKYRTANSLTSSVAELSAKYRKK